MKTDGRGRLTGAGWERLTGAGCGTTLFVAALAAVLAWSLWGTALFDKQRSSRPGPVSVAGRALPHSGADVDAGPPEAAAAGLRVVAYNIQWGMGADGVHNLDRIVDQLRRIDADVVLLNEVDVRWRRSGNVDQPRYIREGAGYEYAYFGRALTTWASGMPRLSAYGNLLLSRFPIVSARTVPLPGGPGREPRSAIAAELDVTGRRLLVIGTHLGLHRGDRLRQGETLRRLAKEGGGAWTIVLGDFNARPDGPEIALLKDGGDGFQLVDAYDEAGIGPGCTFPYPEPYARIDYVFLSPDLARGLQAAAALPVAGSDHLPVVVDVALPAALPVSTDRDRISARTEVGFIAAQRRDDGGRNFGSTQQQTSGRTVCHPGV